MRKALFFISCLFLFATSLPAALPPLFQDIAELKAIFDDPQLGQLLQSGEAIKEIQHTEKGYVISTNKNILAVEIVYASAARPGPAKFFVKFSKPKPRLN